jgi:aldose sugar dehydrogenase
MFSRLRPAEHRRRGLLATIVASALVIPTLGQTTGAAAEGPSLVDPNLRLDTLVDGLALPTSIAFLGPDDLLVLEKNSGQVKRVTNGVVTSTVLDLAVNNASERGLLGIALAPNFPADPGVFLYWTCRATATPDADSFLPEEQTCSDAAMTGADTDDILQVPLLGNRVDRFEWNGTTLTYDHNLITLRAFQNDGGPTPPNQGDSADGPHGQQPPRGNHDAGVITFGPDGKLYVLVGDVGRRGALQNLPCGPTATTCPGTVTPDDQFGGPEPDDAHFTGVILRLNYDGTAPTDNPFYATGASMGGEVGRNLQKVYAYGVRNSFGMAFDPISGFLWDQENGEDAFDEINRVERGMNSGWIQIMGPSSRIDQYKQIETTSLHNEDFPNLQQFRWGPERIADTPAEAKSRFFVLPGSRYGEPEFSWKWVVPPAAIGFVDGRGLGAQYAGDLLVGPAEAEPLDGVVFRFNLTGNRRAIGVDDPRLEDRVADNLDAHDLTESESLLFGSGFGIVTDIETAPDGSVLIVSLTHGTIYRISGK